MLFEWDEQKDKINQELHGIKFIDAAKVFLDPFYITIEDNTTPVQEQRYLTIGCIDGGYRILLVVHTHRDDNGQDIIRIISARKLSKGEVKKYGYR
ncbi:BrnT family toxin [Acinetobacter puyangensis]|uniref:BrnT family toxin n=1 Tax=Acinetobacter puyangensis TaxID=1096779 RepID=UPI003A4D87AD